MTNKDIGYHAIILFIFMMISIPIYMIVNRGIHFMLIWNAILAFLPIIFIFLFDRFYHQKYMKWLYLVLWLLFYPNSIYLISDLIYLNQDMFIIREGIYQPLIYLQDFTAYLSFFHLFLGAMYGVFTALVSFKYFYYLIRTYRQKLTLAYYFILPIIVSLAVYIGRFLRFNSWDILRPLAIIKELFYNMSLFTLFYIVLFAFIQYIIFGVFILVKKNIIHM